MAAAIIVSVKMGSKAETGGAMSINLRRLRAFVTIAEMRSVTEAARKLNMTPPAVTKSLRELETTLSIELFHRTSSGMLLTAAGETFLLHAERALSEIERGREEVAMLTGGVGGRVAIGATAEASILVLPTALGRLIERRPQIEISMRGGTFENLIREVRMSALDLFLGVAPPGGVSADLVSDPLYADELRVVVRPGHPLASREKLSLNDLSGLRWIQSASHGRLAQLMRSSFEEAGVPFPENTIIVEPLSSMRGMLQNTDLLAAVTSVRMRDELELGQLVELPVTLPNTRHIVSIIRRDEVYLSSWAKQLITLLRQTANKLGVAV
jgi:DNA-binding transcriptional LysR family regulator